MDFQVRHPVPPTKELRTVLFADVCKSTQLYEQLGDSRALEIIGHAVALLSGVASRHKGVVVKTIGDEVMCTFPDVASACSASEEMHRSVKSDPALAPIGLSIKVGLHLGEILHENGDVFGDAVNVAARMVGLAKSDQIIATDEVVDGLPTLLRSNTRSLGEARVRGKADALRIYEYLWQTDRGALTSIAGRSWDELRAQASQKQLTLEYGAQRMVLTAEQRSLSLGRGEQNDLVVPRQNVSRQHATIEFSGGHFVLTDRSTNGTYVRMGSEDLFLHRDQAPLLDEGTISLGEALRDGAGGDLIRFKCEG